MFKEIENNRKALLRYIESAYHLSDENLLRQREQLLNDEGVIAQCPYIESGAKYKTNKKFADLNIPAEIAKKLTALAKAKLLFDPPYLHQAEAIEAVLTDKKNIIVTTGTGSGKTECFLLPILGRLIGEIDKLSFQTRAVRSLLLYPMNALVNDQLGRLRRLFGSQQCFDLFTKASNRPVKFGRYTGRTLFPGRLPDVGNKNFNNKINGKLSGLKFYLDLADKALNHDDEKERKKANDTIKQLVEKGKFPIKYPINNLAKGFIEWYGERNSYWTKNGKQCRAVENLNDPELILRYEMQDNPPDILVTNYSMLEYMLLRPIERKIFTETKKYYKENPNERFILVLDESHLYNGAQGTEVAMLIRRLKERLGLRLEQFQVICTSASFGEKEESRKFAAELNGVDIDTVIAITSDDKKVAHLPSGEGTQNDANWLAEIEIDTIRKDENKIKEISEKLRSLPVFGRLANLTSLSQCEKDKLTHKNKNAEAPQELDQLSEKLFAGIDKQLAKTATDKLIELASLAKNEQGNSLFSARVHRFYRGLSGLWACSDPDCSALSIENRNQYTGKLYTEPRRYCKCEHRVFELHSCKKCGSPFFYAWTDNIDNPHYLWSENVGKIDGIKEAGNFDNAKESVQPIQILLQEPQKPEKINKSEKLKYFERYLNISTGTLLESPTANTRPVWIPADKGKDGRRFTQCPICSAKNWYISNHRTKGDMPFQHLIVSQLLEQPEQPNSTTSLKGRKLLIFSDARQAASRLAGTLTKDSMRDTLRALMLEGYRYLAEEKFKENADAINEIPSLNYSYAACLIGAIHQDIALSPILKSGELFNEHYNKIKDNIKRDNLTWNTLRKNIESFDRIPESMLTAIYDILLNENSNYHALGLARIIPDLEDINKNNDAEWDNLPLPKTIEKLSNEEQKEWKQNLLDLWIQLMLVHKALKLRNTPSNWIDNDNKYHYLKRHEGRFVEDFKFIIQDNSFVDKNFSEARNSPARWIKYLRKNWGLDATANGFFLNSGKLFLKITKTDEMWLRCKTCTKLFPFNSLIKNHCPFCSSKNSVEVINPIQELSSLKRIEVYREQTDRLNGKLKYKPYPFIAKEHTAAIGDIPSGSNDAFALSEKYEIRFQDIELPPQENDIEQNISVDVLSCTTTMEVGIDIGSLTAVAMRNVPPNRSNYQQRAGRAGRRGAALSTINTYADTDSHNQQYFSEPAEMIGGAVKSPILNIDNEEIVKRHLFAQIFSMFQQERINETYDSNVFSALGKVKDFRNGKESEFSFAGLEQWLHDKRQEVLQSLKTILLGTQFKEEWINAIPNALLTKLREKHLDIKDQQEHGEEENTDDDKVVIENENSPRDTEKLLDFLFDISLLPSYSFPIDVVAMHVFDKELSQKYKRPVLKYAPQYGLTQALSSYAPGREVYIDGKRHYSFAIWSPYKKDFDDAWNKRKLYYECSCGYVELKELSEGNEGEKIRCPGCNQETLGPARIWLIPTGFAQPVDMQEELPENEMPDDSFTTRARLIADFKQTPPFYSDAQFAIWKGKKELILTNRGANEEKLSGFNFCQSCGRIEPAEWISDKRFTGQQHTKPFPVNKQKEKQDCNKYKPERIVLGTKFNSDVVLFRLNFGDTIRLSQGSHLARITLGTLATAMSQTAVNELEIASNNIGGEFQPSATTSGQGGAEADVFLYDNVADGAGFVQAATQSPREFLQKVLQRLENCDCEHACQRCLQNYQNRFLHGDLDRRTAAGLLRFLLNGTLPSIDELIEDRLLRILKEDLCCKEISADMENGVIKIDNSQKTAIILSHSLLDKIPSTERAKQQNKILKADGWEIVIIPHLLIDRALPAATQHVLSKIQK
ncbi:MAG: DEAD/DEAH box helicase [Planctomycetaceae bacterium]|jgi:ATP-dependent helicase YprA (DUF1998 family)|nr:DEAD/DEAH box helicase [Planctomycetaceae bacterium]